MFQAKQLFNTPTLTKVHLICILTEYYPSKKLARYIRKKHCPYG